MRFKQLLLTAAFFVLMLTGCSAGEASQPITYEQITAEAAKRLMDEHPEAVILDVREQDEFDAGHIPEARLLPVGSVSEETAASVIPKKDTLVLVYCRSGRRSKLAAEALTQLGYSNVKEFGGIIDWPYETE